MFISYFTRILEKILLFCKISYDIKRIMNTKAKMLMYIYLVLSCCVVFFLFFSDDVLLKAIEYGVKNGMIEVDTTIKNTEIVSKVQFYNRDKIILINDTINRSNIDSIKVIVSWNKKYYREIIFNDSIYIPSKNEIKK